MSSGSGGPKTEELQQQERFRRWDLLLSTVEPFLPAGRDGAPGSFADRSCADVGCGVGTFARRLGRRAKRVVGIDTDAALLQVAASAANAPALENVSFVHADVHDLQYRDTFDVVFCSYTLAYWEDPRAGLYTLTNMLKEGGLLVVVEIQALFSAHHPMPEASAEFFRKFDGEGLGKIGYRTNSGSRLPELAKSIDILGQCKFLDWGDDELCFDGRASAEVLESWELRWKRLLPFIIGMAAGNDLEYKRDFFSCLTQPDHTSRPPITLLIGKKTPLSVEKHLESARRYSHGDEDDGYGGGFMDHGRSGGDDDGGGD